jgi:signal transduction histidine kinase
VTPEDPTGRSALLERQLRRERAARMEAERIAERGLRELYEANRLLDQRVAERTVQLEQARGAALEAAQARTEFLASLSHQVGTPLQTIVSAVELVTTVDEQDHDRLREAAAAAEALGQLFRNLLELAQCEVGDIPATPVSVEMVEIADRLEQRWSARLATVGKLLSPEGSGMATVDPDRMVQIGDLLLDNAFHHADPGLVQLGIWAEGGGARLEVADSGPGVSAADLEVILEPFVQLRDAPTPRLGSGVGLALARGLAHRLGGTAVALPNAAGGLTVTVRLPDPSVAERDGAAPRTSAAGRQR